MTHERGATHKGNPITLVGPVLQPGDPAPAFNLNKNLKETVSLGDFAGKIKLISVVPSIDTGTCDMQTRRFNEEAANLGEQVAVITVSADLPFAQARWCGAAGVDRVVLLSDYKGNTFGQAYGVLIKEYHLDMRAIFVLDKNDKITYVEVLGEMGDHPDYEAAVNAVKRLL